MELMPVVLTHLAAFLLFIWVIKKYAVGPVVHLLDERRVKIAEEFDQIDSDRKQVAALKEEYEANIREIDEEARKRAQEEAARGRRIAEEIVEAARAEASALVEKAHASMQAQIDQARADIRNDVIALTLAATEKLLAERLDDAKHRELVGSFIDELEQRN